MSIEPFLEFADLLAEATLLVSGSGVVLAANRGVASRLGLSPSRLRGKRLDEVAADPPEALAAYLRACSRTREPLPGSLALHLGDGGTLICRAEGTVLRPSTRAAHEEATTDALIMIRLVPRQATTQFEALSQKINELDREIQRRVRVEQELREHREWLGVTLASIADAVIATDTVGTIMFLNPVAETLTGWSSEEALGGPSKRSSG